MDEQMHIFVKLVESGLTIILEVESWYTVDNVKAVIHNYTPVIPDQCRITFDGMELDDLRTLADYKIDEESTLLLEEGTSHILVTPWTIIPEHCCITLADAQLDDHQTLSDYEINDGSTLPLEEGTLQNRVTPPTIIPEHRGIMNEHMYVYVEFVENSQTMTLEVESWYTISNVKAAIQNYEPIIPKHCRITFDGTELDDLQTLADYKIETGSTLLLKKGTLQLYVHSKDSSGGSTITDIHVATRETIANVKAEIESMTGILNNLQILYFEQTRLEDSSTLTDYDIEDYAALELLERQQLQIFVNTLDGRKIMLDVENWYTIDEVKAAIQKKKRISPKDYKLFFEDMALDGWCSLSGYDILEGSILVMIPVSYKK